MIQKLLPLRAVTIRLRFLRLEEPPFFHQPLLRPFLKELLQDKQALDNEPGLWLEAINSGVTRFRRHDEYRFNLFCLPAAYPLFKRVLDALRRLPHSYPGRRKKEGIFAANLEYLGLLDYFTTQPIKRESELFLYDEQALQRELNFWRQQPELIMRFTAPARLKRRKEKGTAYINDRSMLHPGEMERRVCKALANLAPGLGQQCQAGQISYPEVIDRLFWTDNADTLDDGRINPFGGVLGDVRLRGGQGDTPHLPLMILGQYIGMGERRGYGMGRYYLCTPQGQGTTPPPAVAKTRLKDSARIANFEQACHNMARKHPDLRQYIDHSLEEFSPDIEDRLEDKRALNRINLHRLARLLGEGQYKASVLQGVILRRPDRHPRPLAIPPLEDRITQRAVVEVLGPTIERLSMCHSYGYRRGFSRMQARDRILTLYRQGYRWFFEADITEFFDLVSHDEIRNRLESFFPHEPLVSLLMDWVSAPVQFDGRLIQRRTGLPQGSPISPMLANLLLEDFDADLSVQNMQLVRFADDFVVLCKTRHQARSAAQQAEQSLAELGLTFNPEKTGVGELIDGLDFLGYSIAGGLAVEKHRPHHPVGKLHLDSIPAASWLAQLLQREPQLLDELNQRLDKPHHPARLKNLGSAKQRQLPANDLGATLFITPPVKQLNQRDGALEVHDAKSKDLLIREAWNDLAAIVLIGRHNITQRCQLSAMENNVPIHFCNAGGRYQGVSCNQRPSAEGPDLWLLQARHYASESPSRLPLCQALVSARIHNQIQVLRQRQRHDDQNSAAITALQTLLENCDNANEPQLRGYEGQAATTYFQQLRLWVPEEYGFSGRNRRPPRDPFNALLSLGYSVLYSHATSVLQVAGLYVWQGFYHRRRDRHQALASDLMEVYRHLVERTALTLLRSSQLKQDDFYTRSDNACYLTRNGRRIFLQQLQQRILRPVLAKGEEKKHNLLEHMLQTAYQLIRHLRNTATSEVGVKSSQVVGDTKPHPDLTPTPSRWDTEQSVNFFKLK